LLKPSYKGKKRDQATLKLGGEEEVLERAGLLRAGKN